MGLWLGGATNNDLRGSWLDDGCREQHSDFAIGSTGHTEEYRCVTTIDPTDVQDWVDRLKCAAEAGRFLDPALGTRVDRESYVAWPAERTMPAAALRAVLTDPGTRVDPHGIQIRGVRFVDCVDLEYVVFAHPLRLHECVLEQALHAKYAQIRGLTLAQVTVNGGVLANGATIGGQLDLTGAILNNPCGPALGLEGASITNNVLARNGFRATAVIDARGVIIGGDLDLTGAILNKSTNGDGRALALDGAQITGHVYAGDDLDENNNQLHAIDVTGEFSAIGLVVGGDLDLDGANLNNPDGNALVLDRAKITSNVFAQNGFCATGTVRAMGATIGGRLYLDGAILNNPNDPINSKDPDRYALVLDHAEITGSILAGEYEVSDSDTHAFQVIGMVRARGVIIGGDLNITGATLDSPGTAGKPWHAALDLAGAHITGSVLAGEGEEEVKTHPCQVEGTVRAVDATIGHQLDLSGATVKNSDGVALNLEAVTVPRLVLTPKQCTGRVNLVRAQVEDLVVDKCPPRPLSATGWTIGDLSSPPDSNGLRENWRLTHRWLDSTSTGIDSSGATDSSGWLLRWRRLAAWLRRHTAWLFPNKPVSVQPWHALADVYDRNGDPAAARHLRFAAENKVTAQSPPGTRIARIVYCAVAGYGYFPLLSIASMRGFCRDLRRRHRRRNRDDIVPTHPDATHTAVEQHLGDQDAWMESMTYTVNDVFPLWGQRIRTGRSHPLRRRCLSSDYPS